MALASLYIGMDSPEPSLLDNAISSKISCASSNDVVYGRIDMMWMSIECSPFITHLIITQI